MSAPTIQRCEFPDGGFVLHKITLPDLQGRFSAWFNAQGEILAAEQLVNSQSRNPSLKRYAELAQIGKRYVNHP